MANTSAEPKINDTKSSIPEEAAAVAAQMKDAAQDALDQARETAQIAINKGSTEMQRFTDQSSKFVRDNPGLAVVGALGVGVLLGIALRSRD